jgi:ketosteroid isomerase-like protein
VSTASRETAEALIGQQNATFAALYGSGRIDEMAQKFYTSDAIVVPADQPMVRSARDIRALFRGYHAAFESVEIQPAVTVADEAAGFAFQLADATLFERSTRNPVACKYITVWRRESDGWRCVVDFFGFGHLGPGAQAR